ncbi:RING-type domain-containing protein [Plasmodiophora brassicae]
MSILRHVCGQIIPKARTLVLLGILNMVLNVTGDHITLRSANGESFKLPFDTVLKHCRAFRPIHAREVDGRYVDAVSPPQHHDVTFNSNELATLVSVMQNTAPFVEDAGQWVVTELNNKVLFWTRIPRILSAARELKMYSFIVAIGLYVPLPPTGQPVLESLDSLLNEDRRQTTFYVNGIVQNSPRCGLGCRDEYSRDNLPMELPCRHTFHTACVIDMLGQHGCCPLCGRPIMDPDVMAQIRTRTVRDVTAVKMHQIVQVEHSWQKCYAAIFCGSCRLVAALPATRCSSF